MKRKFVTLFVLSFSAQILISSCTSISPDPQSSEMQTSEKQGESETIAPDSHSDSPNLISEASSAGKTPDPESLSSRVEVSWAPPEKSVDGYILNYGYQKDNLSLEQTVMTADLEEKEDLELGRVYSTVLVNLEYKKPVFVSIIAFKGENKSAPSEVMEVR